MLNLFTCRIQKHVRLTKTSLLDEWMIGGHTFKDIQGELKAMLHEAFCNLQYAMQQNVALQVAGKVEISSVFRNVARQVASCDMSIANCNAIL